MRGGGDRVPGLGARRRTGLASRGPFNLWTASGCIAYTTHIDCFAVLARDQNGSLSGLNAGFSHRRLGQFETERRFKTGAREFQEIPRTLLPLGSRSKAHY